MLRSLKVQLVALWCLVMASALATGYLLYEFYIQSAAVQMAQAEVLAARSCREVRDRFAFFATGWTGSVELVDDGLRAQLTDVIEAALARAGGVEGGIWTETAGPVAYAYPTYEGTGPKTDVPSAEFDTLRRLNADALRADRPVALRRASRTQALVLQACPLPGPILRATAWTMLRVPTSGGPAYLQLLAGLGTLSAAVLGSALLLGRLLVVFTRRIARLETRLGAPHDGEELPHLSPTGLVELDRLVAALNAAGLRLAAAHQRATAAERLAAIGRLAAGVAHEIRNPLAAIRLKSENALASPDPARARAAHDLVLGQVARIDRLLRDLLSLTDPRPLAPEPADVPALLAAAAARQADGAGAAGIRLEIAVDLPAARPRLDTRMLDQALDNLLQNAIQNSPEGGTVRLSAACDGGQLRVRVADAGRGVPDAIRERLFEPFVTGRSDGAGLGLAIVREIARAHGGRVHLFDTGPGTTFELELPWRPS